MGDMAEGFKEMKKDSQEKRANNRQMSAHYLESHDIPFTVHNNGAHLVVEGSLGFIDFWPGTGRWSTRGTDKNIPETGFGVRNLVKLINIGKI